MFQSGSSFFAKNGIGPVLAFISLNGCAGAGAMEESKYKDYSEICVVGDDNVKVYLRRGQRG
jgi:hypothetical protein